MTWTDAAGVQKHHDLANDLLFGPGVGDALGSKSANTRDLSQALGLGLDDVEDLFAESIHKFLGVGGPDASDHAGAEVFLDPVD
jgi:hypothetical protein